MNFRIPPGFRESDQNFDQLIEIPHTKGISSSAIRERIYLDNTSPDYRRGLLRRLLLTKNFCRFIETHSPLSAIIAEKAFYKNKKNKKNLMGFGLAL